MRSRKNSPYFGYFPEPDLPINNSKRVYCVEIEKTFDTLEEAAKYVDCEYKEAIACACMHHTMAFGYHWLWD